MTCFARTPPKSPTLTILTTIATRRDTGSLITTCTAPTAPTRYFIRHRDRPFTPAAASAGVTPESPADQKQALAWFESEHAVLLAVLRHATGFDTHIWQLAWALASYFEYQGHWRDWRDSQTMALDASLRLSDKQAQALSHALLGSAFVQLSDYDYARTHLQHALGMYGELGDNAGQAYAHHSLARMLERQGLYSEALPHAQAGTHPIQGGRQ